MKAQVTFEKGHEHYSNVSVEVTPPGPTPAAAIRGMKFLSAGELGSDLVGLFADSVSPVFEFRRQRKINGKTALVYQLHVAAERNDFWALQDSQGVTEHPELRGELWIESGTNRVLRLELRALNLPTDFEFIEVNITTDYSELTISDAGRFQLPYRSATRVCSQPDFAGSHCRTNVLVFHDCRKFGTKTRILDDQSWKR